MLTTPQDQPSPGIANITWCFGNNCACPSTFYFPTFMSTEKHWCVNHYVADLCEQLCEAFKEVQAQSSSEPERQRWYYDYKANVISLEPGNLVLAKSCCLQRENKSERLMGGGTVWNGTPDCWRSPFILCEEPVDQMLTSPSLELTSSHYPHNGSFFMYRCTSWAEKVHHHCPGGTHLESKWEWESPTECKVSATGPVPDRWDSSRAGQ